MKTSTVKPRMRLRLEMTKWCLFLTLLELFFKDKARCDSNYTYPHAYLNDPRTRRIMVDRERAPLVKKIFERYATGSSTLDNLRHFLADLAVVESFTAVWWLTQNHHPHAVATMGADCSDEQAELIVRLVKPDGRVWILSDGDPAGERFAHSVLTKVSSCRFVRWVKLGEGVQPTDLMGEEIRNCFKM